MDDIVTSRAVRSNRSKEPDSDRFSWDPNSRNRSSRASSKNRRDPSRDNSRSGSVTHSPKTSPEFCVKTSRVSPGVGTHNRLSPGDGGGYQGGGHLLHQDWRVDSRLAPSVARSSSIEFGNNGGKFIKQYRKQAGAELGQAQPNNCHIPFKFPLSNLFDNMKINGKL